MSTIVTASTRRDHQQPCTVHESSQRQQHLPSQNAPSASFPAESGPKLWATRQPQSTTAPPANVLSQPSNRLTFNPATPRRTLAWGVLRGRMYTLVKSEFGRAALKALALDSDLAEAHVAVAGIHEDECAWAEAGRSYRQALELNPASLVGCGCYAYFLANVGRTSDALTVIERAAKVNPLSGLIQSYRVCSSPARSGRGGASL
jgi:hypothetical protein